MTSRKPLVALLTLPMLLAAGCDEAAPEPLTIPDGETTKVLDEHGKADSSVEAIFVDFEFDGELIASSSFNAANKIEDQLLYTVGHLNGDNSVGRLDRLQLSNIQTSANPGGGTRISYHAVLPVAWGDRDDVPSSYTLQLPHDIRFSALDAFTDDYGHDCVDFSAHDVTAGSMWYYYRPNRAGCQIADDDIIVVDAEVSVSSINTTGKYPEYDKVWEDGVLRVVVVHGKYEDGATSNSDAGIAAYNRFVRSIKTELSPHDLVTTPAEIPFNAGIDNDDTIFEATLDDGKQVVVNALLVDNVRTDGPEFDSRYASLSTDADLIVYSGHAGLGANIRALANKGQWKTGQYAIVFMNGCDTYAYVDSALFDAHAAINADDPTGTKYVDIVTNAMPAFFHETANSGMALIRGLLAHDAPQTYEQMFVNIDADQVVLVSGEEDNTYVPGGGGGGDFEPILVADAVQRGESFAVDTGVVKPGTYTVTLEHDPANPGGDADLYVRTGAAPTTSAYDCRPYLDGSAETCTVQLGASDTIFVSVVGYSQGDNHFVLRVEGEGDTPPPPVDWDGMDESGTVAANEEARFETPTLAAGEYVFELSGDNDADLYVRIGTAPTQQLYDCRPFKSGSNETCAVSLPAAAPIHVMVRGWAQSSSWNLVGRPQ